MKKKKIIELHNRPYLLKYLLKKNVCNPILLYFHNDPTKMKGSISINERKEILKNVSGLVFVSQFLKEKFIKGLKTESSKLFVIPNSLNINKNALLSKQRRVLFVGRLVKEKGVEIYVNAVKDIANSFPQWEFLLVGNSGKRKKFFNKDFEKKIISQFENISSNTKYLEFIPNHQVLNLMAESSILVVPSLWEEPFGLTAIEGISNRMVVIGNNVGGLTDIISNRGILINNIDEKKLSKTLHRLFEDPKQILNIQNKCLDNYIYSQNKVSIKQDLIRKKIYEKFFNDR